jgi:hypothetical protein
VSARELADGAVTRSKLHASLRAGWVRLPFKPSPFPRSAKETSGAVDFVIGVTKTYCDARGAKGTMGIPVPPGATGERNEKGIRIELYLCGWRDDRPEEGTKFAMDIPGKRSSFRESSTLNWELDEAMHAIALYVYAQADADISLVAAEFE